MVNDLIKAATDDVKGLGPAMRALSPKHRIFVLALFTANNPGGHGSRVEAARAAGYGLNSEPNVVKSIAQNLLHRGDIQAAVKEFAEREMIATAPAALRAMKEILNDRGHKDRYKAAHALAERASPTIQKVEVNVDVTVDYKRDALEHLKHLKSIGATREMLEKEFGYSGLPYYEKLLAQQEAVKLPAPEVVDAEFTEIEVDEIDWSKEKSDE